MVAPRPNPSSNNRPCGPTLAFVILGLIVLLFAAFLFLGPKRPGAIDNGVSPATTQH